MLHFTQINPLRDRWVFLAVIEVVEHCVMDAEVGGVWPDGCIWVDHRVSLLWNLMDGMLDGMYGGGQRFVWTAAPERQKKKKKRS